MGPATPITLGDRERTLRFGLRNCRLATQMLQAYIPQGAAKLDIGQAALLLLRGDQDAILVFLWQGLLHESERLTVNQVERWLEHEMDAKRSMEEFSRPILDALKAAGLITINYRPGVEEEDAEPSAVTRPLIRAVESPRD